MPATRTLILLKPDAVQRGLVSEVLARFERKGLRIVGLKFLVPSKAQAEAHYAEHAGKPFFPSLLAFITSSPLVALCLEGDQAVPVCPEPSAATSACRSPTTWCMVRTATPRPNAN
jgi:nucleoside-diphosphate kinase